MKINWDMDVIGLKELVRKHSEIAIIVGIILGINKIIFNLKILGL